MQANKLNDINPLMIPLLAALETGLNQLFAMDADSFSLLARFKGRIVAFQLTDLNQTLYFFTDQQGFQIVSHYEGEADTLISGSLIAFARMAMADEKSKTSAVFNGDIKITGDIALGQHFQALFKHLDIDWEEHLSRITGDVLAHSLGNIARSFIGWGKQTINSLSVDVGEYVQYESGDIASGPEISQFNEQIDTIRSDVDRADARLERLLQVTKAQATPSTKKKSVE